ncbi:hypothetical protein CLV42_102655 [Chitinophaga ginsengisoli]|uniref:Uncharacterized protein n=1 Tax=Chitinophaga ginsengisoli TaxID=363837 RepID=A0A2P8GM85_9BACT|nr:hypothetical protein CLV42_102655 [Chitinophaga ginsengisoli]
MRGMCRCLGEGTLYTGRIPDVYRTYTGRMGGPERIVTRG